MINNIKIQNSNNNISFRAKEDKTKPYTADMFISDVQQAKENMEKGNFLTRYPYFSMTSVPFVLGMGAYEIKTLKKLNQLKKQGDTNGIKNVVGSFVKTAPLVSVAGAASYFAIKNLCIKNSEKKREEFEKYLNDTNKTNSKINLNVFRSLYKGAECSVVNGNINVNSLYFDFPVFNKQLKKIINHELVHAKQYETVARMPDGIKKLNYACMKSIANDTLKNNFEKACEEIYNEIQLDKTGRFENLILSLPQGDINFKNYITAIHILLQNKNATYNDIPMVIDEKHYSKIVEQQGPLSKEEEKKAQEYYQAIIDYPQSNFIQMLNPFSKYHNNPLEIEAYKENPGIIEFIRKLFNQNAQQNN